MRDPGPTEIVIARMRGTVLLGVAMALFAVSVAACGGQSRDAVIAGVVKLCGGGERPLGRPVKCFIPTQVRVSVAAANGTVVARSRPANGRFSFSLAPGVYFVSAESRGILIGGKVAIHAVAGRTTRLIITEPVHSASPTARHDASGQCLAAQLAMVRPPSGRVPPQSFTVFSTGWEVQLVYRNRGPSCTLIFPRTLRLSNQAGNSASTPVYYQPSQEYRARHNERFAIILRMFWSPGRRGVVHACPAVLRNITSATAALGPVKLTFPVNPAFGGVCRDSSYLGAVPYTGN